MSSLNAAVEDALASAVAAALRRDRHDRRERRRLRHERGAEGQAARSRSPRPRAEEVLFPEDWPSPSETVEAPPGNFEVPGPRTPPGVRFLATSAKYGGVPTHPSSSGSFHSAPESELRARRRISRAAASDASWQEEVSPSPPPRRMLRRPAGAAPPPDPEAGIVCFFEELILH